MTRVITLLAAALLSATSALGADRYQVKGVVVTVSPSARRFTASIEEIPGFMAAMTMPFEVRDVKSLAGLAPGTCVEFALVVDSRDAYAEAIRIVPFQNVERDPFAASRLALLNQIVSGQPVTPALSPGTPVPDFTLTDQRRRRLSLSQLRGKVVAIDFVYTRCALPNFCLRLSNNFNALKKRFAARLGKDLVLLTISFDPTHDTPEVLAGYAAQWQADPSTWRFLTGSEEDIRRICQLFGVHAFTNEGLMDHSLHTVLVDRRGILVANLEGNQFTPAQIGDLAESFLR